SAPAHGAKTGRGVLAGARTSSQRRLGGALQKPPAATRAAKSSLGAGSEPSAGAGERARTHRHSLSRTELAVSRNSLGFFYGEEQGVGGGGARLSRGSDSETVVNPRRLLCLARSCGVHVLRAYLN